jgi:tetratricopeptide (TPR) repeat protein
LTAALVASICRRLDGMPLALELAAARLSSMSLVHLHDRLDQRFRLLTGGDRTALARQQTLRATVDWSFHILSESERAVLCRLSVFSGSFELEAAESVAALGGMTPSEVDDILGSLVNKSLVVAEQSSERLRYRLLETIRQYASEQLIGSGGEAGVRQVRDAQAEYYLGLAKTAAPGLLGPRLGTWLKRLDLEWDNIRSALAYLFAEPDRSEDVLRLGVALDNFFAIRGHLEAIATLRSVLDCPDGLPASLRVRGLCAFGVAVAITLGMDSRLEMRAARELMRQGLQLARDLDDQALIAEALSDLSWTAEYQGDSGQAALFANEALQVARSLGDPRLIGNALGPLALVTPTAEAKRGLWLEALAYLRQAGDTVGTIAQLLPLAALELDAGRLEAARALYEEAIAVAEDEDFHTEAVDTWGGLALVLLLQGKFEEAALRCRKSLLARRRLGLRTGTANDIFKLACCATGMGNYLQAAQLTGAHDVMHAKIDVEVVPEGAFKWNKWTPLEQKVREDNRAALRRVLGEVEFERAYAVGRGLSFDQAADLALGKVRSG